MNTMIPAYEKYRPKDNGWLLLDANERHGFLDVGQWANYPQCELLNEALAKKFSLHLRQVLVTAGADEAIDRFFRAFLREGTNIVMPLPTFEMLPRYARLVGASLRSVEWLSREFPLEAFCDAVDEDTAAIALVSPNNPTGLTVPLDAIVTIAKRAPHVSILFDAAYVEFARVDPTEIALTFENIVVTRTFSKAYGLAGIRIGYALGSQEKIARMRACGSPYSVSQNSVDIALQTLLGSKDKINSYVKRIAFERSALIKILSGLGASCLPSEGNFVFACFDDARSVAARLQRDKILVREFCTPPVENALRITCPGDETSFVRLCASLRGEQ